MARRALPGSDHVPIGLTVSETDAAQIDEVLSRPEFAGWSRSEWCREIIRTALRYYVKVSSVAGPGEARASARPAAAQAAPPAERPAPASQQAAPSPREQRRLPAERPAPPVERPAAPPARPTAPAGSTSGPAGSTSGPAGGTSGPADEPAAGAAGPVDRDPGEAPSGSWDAPGPPAQPECAHPADARDYERGVCAACGAVIWD